MERSEAIERIKARYDKWALDNEDMKAIQALIPELKESEDERIRKELLEEIEFIIPHDDETDSEGLILPSYHARIDRYKSYLEKHKEPKPVEWEWPNLSNCIKNCKKCQGKCFYRKESYEEQKPAEKLSKEEYVKKFKALCDAYEIKLPNREYDIYGLCEDLHKLFGDIQNPAEWSEDTIRKAIEEVGLTQHQINWFKNNVFPPKQEWSKEEKERIRQSGRLDVCYNPEKYGLCHKTEWGDGEMKALDSIIDDYELAAKSFCGHDGKIMFLKAIRDGEYGLSKQEWSEEDKVMLNNIIWGVHMKSIKPLDEMDDRSKYERYEDFLKALPERFNLQPRTEWSEEDEQTFLTYSHE